MKVFFSGSPVARSGTGTFTKAATLRDAKPLASGLNGEKKKDDAPGKTGE